MVKKAILLLSAVAGITSIANAQKCATSELQAEFIKQNPKVAEVQKAMDMEWRGAMSKTTSSSLDYDHYIDSVYAAATKNRAYIPTVVHVIHDFGAEYVTDDQIFTMIKRINDAYQKKNADLSAVIAPFVPYIGNANIELRLAQKDPIGNPTNGITRRQSYLTVGGDEQAKFDQWAPNRYLNIWIDAQIGRKVAGGIVAAYATLPSGAASNPYSDGVISAYPFIGEESHTVAHEVGHYLNLYHVWSPSEQVEVSGCGDDEVDDTPPTTGHFSVKACDLYDTACSLGYMKTYPWSPGNGLPIQNVIVDYPDTNNTQNIMDYSSCTNMFTKQQVLRMRTALNSPTADRNNLIDPQTTAATGILTPTDIPPVAAFSVENLGAERTYYMCQGQPSNQTFVFKNRSWRDTVTSAQWEFTNGGAPVSQTQSQLNDPVRVVFTEPGWAKIKITANSNAGSGTTESQAVYVADRNYLVEQGYYQEFNDGSYDKWPSFNYYNNDTKWQVVNNTGFYDHTCIMYTGFDKRVTPNNKIGNFGGDHDDFFTPAYDLSGMQSGDCNINFMTSGAFRTSVAEDMRDRLELAYSTDCGASWHTFDSVVKSGLANKGTFAGQYAPLWTGDWTLQSKNIPVSARTSKTFFRFRYKPSVDQSSTQSIFLASGNNFYLDRINISPFPLGMNTLMGDGQEVVVAPNPTNGTSFVLIKSNGNNATAQVQVTDITGKLVYSVQERLSGALNRIEIPASAIATKGVYMVHVVTGDQTHTEKLVSY